jgi:hypothetical protein
MFRINLPLLLLLLCELASAVLKAMSTWYHLKIILKKYCTRERHWERLVMGATVSVMYLSDGQTVYYSLRIYNCLCVKPLLSKLMGNDMFRGIYPLWCSCPNECVRVNHSSVHDISVRSLLLMVQPAPGALSVRDNIGSKYIIFWHYKTWW